MAQQLCQCRLTVVRFFPTAMFTALVRHQLKKLEYTHQLALEIWQKAAAWLLWSHNETNPLSIPDILEGKPSLCACKIINYFKEQNCVTFPLKCDHKVIEQGTSYNYNTHTERAKKDENNSCRFTLKTFS